MHRVLLPLALLLAVPAAAQPTPSTSSGQAVAGDWQGALDVGGTRLTLVVHLTPADSGYAVTFDSPDQGAYGLPADDATLDGMTLAFAAPNIGAAYAGTVSADGATIEGAWTQGGRDFPLTLTRVEAPAEQRAAPKARPKSLRGDLTGDWGAALQIPGGGEVRLTLHLTRNADGYTAALTGPDGTRVNLDEARVDGRRVRIASGIPPVTIVGTVSEDEAAIEGEWQQGGEKLPVTFTRR
jgi:hypothetical protein